MSSKKSKSFADALLSADVSDPKPSVTKPKKPVKTKVVTDHSIKKSKSKEKKHKGSSSSSKKCSLNSLTEMKKDLPISDSSDEEVKSAVNMTFDRSKYGESVPLSPDKRRVRKPQSAKIIEKLLKEDEETKKRSKMLKEVDEDKLLFNCGFDDDQETEEFVEEEQKIPVLPPGTDNIHSLSCHPLYTLSKIRWPFTAESVKVKRGDITGHNTAVYLSTLSEKEVQQSILDRTFMDSEIEFSVLEPLLLYLIRFIAASPHKRGATKLSRESLVESSFQLILFHVNTSSYPRQVLLQCLSEIPLALVNIGCDVSCFPPSILEKWKVGELHHNKAPNSVVESVEQMKVLHRLLTIMCNCLARAAETSTNWDVQKSSVIGTLDNHISWLVLLSQDPKVVQCSLQTLVGDAVCHALELYPNFNTKVQDLVEIIYSQWASTGEEDAMEDDSEPKNENIRPFPHHDASYVCSTILSATPRARKLSSSLSFLCISVILECEEMEVLDNVEMIDIIELLNSRRTFLLQSCQLYQLRSLLLLLDNCVSSITEVLTKEEKEESKPHYLTLEEFLKFDCAKMLGGTDATSNSSNISRLKAQLTGLKSSLSDKWEKIWLSGERLFNPSGVNITRLNV